MTASKQGLGWRGTDAADLGGYLRACAAGGSAVADVVHAACAACDRLDEGFSSMLDDEEGAAIRTCGSCHAETAILDNADFLEDAEL